jgi:hypothetical protein
MLHLETLERDLGAFVDVAEPDRAPHDGVRALAELVERLVLVDELRELVPFFERRRHLLIELGTLALPILGAVCRGDRVSACSHPAISSLQFRI